MCQQNDKFSNTKKGRSHLFLFQVSPNTFTSFSNEHNNSKQQQQHAESQLFSLIWDVVKTTRAWKMWRWFNVYELMRFPWKLFQNLFSKCLYLTTLCHEQILHFRESIINSNLHFVYARWRRWGKTEWVCGYVYGKVVVRYCLKLKASWRNFASFSRS